MQGQDEYLHGDVTRWLIGAFYDVYNELGVGFLEEVYERAMELALSELGLEVRSQVAVPVWFRGHQIGDYIADLLVEGVVIVELKAARGIDPAHESQLLNYLRATAVEVGLLLNFGPKPEVRRRIFDNDRKRLRARPDPPPH